MFFFFATWWFWIALLGLVILFWSASFEGTTIATIGFILTLVLLQFLGDVPIWEWIKNHPMQLGLGLLAYFPIGACWSVFKWYLYLIEARDEIRSQREDTVYISYQPQSNQNLKRVRRTDEEWKEYVKERRPNISKEKERVLFWIMYWPVSVIWILLNDVIEKIVKSIFNTISGFLGRLTDKVWKDV